MIWLAGIIAIALLLAILELEPNQLYVLSSLPSQMGSDRWQMAAYLLLLIIVLLGLGYYLTQLTGKYLQLRSQLSATANNPPKIITQNLASSTLRLTLWGDLSRQGLVKIIFKLSVGLLLLLAVLCNGVAQRMAFIEASPQRTVYVDALVTPIGLSDKRLEVKQGSVLQGYRQLVRLSHIQLNSIHNDTPKAEEKEFVINGRQITNPFNDISDLAATSQLNQSTTMGYLPSGPKLPPSMTVMLQSYQANHNELNQLAPDKQLSMRLALHPLELKDPKNEDEFDEYRWLSSRHATAKADMVNTNYQSMTEVSTLSLPQSIDVMRFKFRQHFLQWQQQRLQKSLGSDDSDQTNGLEILQATETDNTDNTEQVENTDNQDGLAVTLSLLTGDRSLISDDMTALYRFGGISHLLAISGTHVLFLALLCAALVTAVINRLKPTVYNVLPRWQCSFIIAVITAFGYALFAGFDVPAVRTACMLLLVGVMRYFLAVPAIFKMLLLLAVAMAWSDIFVLWQAGFWLSFVAVAVLVAYSQRWERAPTSDLSLAAKLQRQLIALFKLQLWMSIALLPISLWLFGKVSLWGFGVNLFAIGLFGWVIVPLNLLAGLLYVIIPNNSMSSLLWSLLVWILDQLHGVLLLLHNILNHSGWLYTDISLPVLGLLLLLVLPWLLPKAMISRLFTVMPLLAIAVLAYADSDSTKDPLYITVLNPQHSQYAAYLIQNKQQAWLLLSAYEKNYNNSQPTLTQQQQKKLAQTLYDQLRAEAVNQLTGVIVQTETASLAAVIGQIESYLPISYYWQAGLGKHKAVIDEALSATSLQAQRCHSGKQWPDPSLRPQQGMITESSKLGTQTPHLDQQAVIDYANRLSLHALTGWDQINDSRVWDCAIELATTQPIYLRQQGAEEQLFSAVKESAINGTAVLNKVSNQRHSETNKVLLYSSANPQLAKLWPLMCPSQSPPLMADMTVKPSAKISTESEISTDYNYLGNGYWLSPSQAIIETNLIDSFQPKAWKITGQNTVPATSQLIESHLYWRQSQSVANLPKHF